MMLFLHKNQQQHKQSTWTSQRLLDAIPTSKFASISQGREYIQRYEFFNLLPWVTGACIGSLLHKLLWVAMLPSIRNQAKTHCLRHEDCKIISWVVTFIVHKDMLSTTYNVNSMVKLTYDACIAFTYRSSWLFEGGLFANKINKVFL